MGTDQDIPKALLVALGGNAIHPGGIKGTYDEQVAIAAATGKALLPLMALDNELIITHGNGPVVGKILMRQAIARDRVAPMPLDICVAHSQGGIAYLLMQALENALRDADNPRHMVCLLTQVEAAIRFLERGGKRVVIGSLDAALAALRGEAGTHIVADDA